MYSSERESRKEIPLRCIVLLMPLWLCVCVRTRMHFYGIRALPTKLYTKAIICEWWNYQYCTFSYLYFSPPQAYVTL